MVTQFSLSVLSNSLRPHELQHARPPYEFEQALGVGDGQGSLACCSAWDHKDTTEQLN